MGITQGSQGLLELKNTGYHLVSNSVVLPNQNQYGLLTVISFDNINSLQNALLGVTSSKGGSVVKVIPNNSNIEALYEDWENRELPQLKQQGFLTGLDISKLKLDVLNTIDGHVAFELYDTYGFPMDLTADIARERNLSIDEAGFNACMDAQRERSQKAGKFNFDYNSLLKVDVDTVFTGYDSTCSEGKVVAMFIGDEAVNHVNEGQKAVVVLDKTAFYAESGGQVGDTGVLSVGHTRFEVQNTTKVGNAFLHHGIVTQGQLLVNDTVEGQVDNTLRANTARNHSATHLLHAALRQTLGTHVQQKGSLVCSDYLRFDFSHTEGVTAEQISQIEALVNGQILANSTVATEVTDIDTAKAKGAMALFGEKYGDTVRVLSMGTDNFSVELCGGTHVSRTGDIGLLKITSEGGVAAGIRRIEAKTGSGALAWLAEGEQALAHIGQLVKGSRQAVADKVQQLAERNRDLEKEIERLKAKLASSASNDLLSQVQDINGVKLLAVKLEGADSKSLRTTLDQLKNKLASGVIVLATVEGDKVTVIAGVTADLTTRFKAGDLVQHISTQLGGKGGGRPDMAQGGGTNVAALPQALNSVSLWLQQK
ncbi:MAG: alanine--tRNA ligase [Agitococcus sp.]